MTPDDPRKLVAHVFASVNAFFEQPAIKEFYRREAEKEAKKRRAQEAAEKAERERIEAQKRKDRAYDSYVLTGGSDECTRFGLSNGCAPECPVFLRGECETQAELEEVFQ